MHEVRVAQPGELSSLVQARVEALGLCFADQPRCDLRGNCERERSTFSWRGLDGAAHQGSLVDVYLRVGPSPLAKSSVLPERSRGVTNH